MPCLPDLKEKSLFLCVEFQCFKHIGAILLMVVFLEVGVVLFVLLIVTVLLSYSLRKYK